MTNYPYTPRRQITWSSLIEDFEARTAQKVGIVKGFVFAVGCMASGSILTTVFSIW
jgi:hypothetical protein